MSSHGPQPQMLDLLSFSLSLEAAKVLQDKRGQTMFPSRLTGNEQQIRKFQIGQKARKMPLSTVIVGN